MLDRPNHVVDEFRLVSLVVDLDTLGHQSSCGTVQAIALCWNILYKSPATDLAIEGRVGGEIVPWASNSSKKHDLGDEFLTLGLAHKRLLFVVQIKSLSFKVKR